MADHFRRNDKPRPLGHGRRPAGKNGADGENRHHATMQRQRGTARVRRRGAHDVRISDPSCEIPWPQPEPATPRKRSIEPATPESHKIGAPQAAARQARAPLGQGARELSGRRGASSRLRTLKSDDRAGLMLPSPHPSSPRAWRAETRKKKESRRRHRTPPSTASNRPPARA